MKYKLLFLAVTVAGSMNSWAGNALPLLPNYQPSAGETYVSMDYAHTEQHTSTSVVGTGISSVPSTIARTDGALLDLRYGITDKLQLGVAVPYVDAITNSSTGLSASASGWGSPTLSVSKDILKSPVVIAGLNLSYVPKVGSSAFNRNQATILGARYAQAFGSGLWGTLTAGYIFRPGEQPDTVSMASTIVRDLGRYAVMFGVGASKTQNSHLNPLSRTDRTVDWAINAGVGGRATKDWDWVIRYVYGTSRAYERLDTGLGYLDNSGTLRTVQASLLTRF